MKMDFSALILKIIIYASMELSIVQLSFSDRKSRTGLTRYINWNVYPLIKFDDLIRINNLRMPGKMDKL